jgi:phytol kinase
MEPLRYVIATVVTFLLALSWLRLNDYLAHRGVISGLLSRKIIHIGTGPIFVLSWLLFPVASLSRYLAALVPLAITIQFFLVGTGAIKDQAAVDAMSRSGDRREILRGPLFYGIVFVLLTIIYWYDSPVGIVALMLLCGGDGLADIIGSRFDSLSLPWSGRKSMAGSVAMFVGGWFFSTAMLAIFVSLGKFSGPFSNYIGGISLIALVGAIVESLPFKDIDNITVPAVAVVLGHFWLP